MNLVIIYVINSAIAAPFFSYLLWKDQRQGHGKRQAFICAFFGFVAGLIPGSILGVLLALFGGAVDFITKWVSNDPTSPKNIEDPNFELPKKKVKKIKKSKPIENRFEVMDL